MTVQIGTGWFGAMPKFYLILTILGLALTATAAPDEGRRLQKIGVLWLGDFLTVEHFHGAFLDGLREHGYADGQSVIIVKRFAGGDPDRLPGLVAELVAQNVDVILASPRAVMIAKRATRTIPIVSAGMADPVAQGAVNSLARPGGNVTGLSSQSTDSSGKRLQLTMETLPALRHIALLLDASDPAAVVEGNSMRSVARSTNIKFQAFEVRHPRDFDAVFAAIGASRPQALVVTDSALTTVNRNRIAHFSETNRIPFISEGKSFAEAGALLTFGPSDIEMWKRSGGYVAKILKGAKPGDLPIEQPTKFELVVNLKTARALGITIPQSILLRADEVIR